MNHRSNSVTRYQVPNERRKQETDELSSQAEETDPDSSEEYDPDRCIHVYVRYGTRCTRKPIQGSSRCRFHQVTSLLLHRSRNKLKQFVCLFYCVPSLVLFSS